MRLFGYARVSSSKQSLGIQIKALKKAGVEDFRIYHDKETGTHLNRKGLNLLKLRVERGDIVLITKLDRLGRDTLDMVRLIEEFNQEEVILRSIDDGISTEGPFGRMIVIILSAVAQAERHRILERTNEGRLEAQKNGIKFGRRRIIDRRKIIQLYKSGVGATEVAKTMSVARASVYKILKDLKI